MRRVLVVIRQLADLRDAVRTHAAGLASDDVLAICLVRDSDRLGIGHLELQQRMTAQLRLSLGAAAESVATFVVSGQPGDDVASCAASWQATTVSQVVGPDPE